MKKHPAVKPAIWGGIAGAIPMSAIGFSQLGWTLGSTAERMANDRAQTAVVDALAPICVENFQHQADGSAKLAEFRKVSSSWDRRSIVEKSGWATIAGSNTPNSALATACANQLARAL